MAAKTALDLSDEDKSQLAELGAALQRNGVREKEPAAGRATDTPSHEKQSWSERGRVRDLAVEKEGKPEVVQQTQTTWVERLSALRASQNDNTQPGPEKAQAQEADMPREDRSKSSRTASGDSEKTAQSEPVAAKPEASPQATQPAGKTKAGWTDRDKGNQPEEKKSERGTFGKKRDQQAKEGGQEKGVKPRDTPAREQGKTNENER